ncbi:DHHW family protein [Ruminococcus flavefaciens]|uniref:DHHW protein n=1 Tax=Ruminococcus flavefaciens 007c TaxID=1341157 RepID=W7UXU6_RUMFL|nr:DHHW family protein [Ruminococcus flavefaciens]EWM53480.1 hypothetical protein RF007C_07305 [Ruminococcus flavefaciens 007c]
MNKLISKITAVVTLSFIFLFGLLTFLGSKKEYSVDENRHLEGLHEISAEEMYDGSTSRQLEKYMADHFWGRSRWMIAKAAMQTELSESIVNGVYVSSERLLTADPGYTEAGNVSSDADIINSFSKEYDGMVYFAAVPTSAGIYGDIIPSHYVRKTESQRITELYDMFGNDIRRIDTYNILKMLKDSYIYYRNDTKWTVYGAYCVYKTVIQKLGFQPTSYDKFNIEHVTNEFRGNLYNRTLSKRPQADIMDIFYYPDGAGIVSCSCILEDGSVAEGSIYNRDMLKTGDMYSMYLGKPVPVMKIRTSAKNDMKLLVVRDSFADCFIPFLTQHYSEITVISPLEMEGDISDYINVGEYGQTLFLFGIDSLGGEADPVSKFGELYFS